LSRPIWLKFKTEDCPSQDLAVHEPVRADRITFLTVHGCGHGFDAHQGLGQGFASLRGRQGNGKGPALGQGAIEENLVPGDPGTDALMDTGAAGLAAHAGEDEVPSFRGEGLRQPADVQNTPFAEAGAVDAEFPDQAGRRLVGRFHLPEGTR
jgi:hypothetical protein